MRPFPDEAQPALDDLSRRYGFSRDAGWHMLDALVAGRGGMAQFDHPEFGGSGQWMRGGMVMLANLFDGALKVRVEGFCRELSEWLVNRPERLGAGEFQTQSQNAMVRPPKPHLGQAQSQQQDSFGTMSVASLSVTPASETAGHWWGGDLGQPASAGSQNGARYAYFPQARRLAIDLGGRITLYDTLDHQIGGFSQQQSTGGSLTFASQHGAVEVASLPVVSGHDSVPSTPVQSNGVSAPPDRPQHLATAAHDRGDVFNHIERLAELHAKGILNADEFAAKKKDLLNRL